MKHLTYTCFQEMLSRMRAAIFLAIIVALVTVSLTVTSAQGPLPRTGPDVKPARRNVTHPEDVYFNSQAIEVLSPTTLTRDKMSATSIGNVLTLLFDTARVSLQTESDPLTATWVGTITVPTTTSAGKKPKSYLQHIRGSVTKTPDTKVTVFFELGGKGFVAEFPYGMKFDGNILRKFISAIKPGSGARYTATIVIHAERRDSKSALLIDIDGLDVDAR